MTNLGTTILADEQLQDIVDPFDLFHKPETDPHHIDSKWVTARQKLHLPDYYGPIYIEVNNFDENYQDTSAWCLQTEELDFIKKNQKWKLIAMMWFL